MRKIYTLVSALVLFTATSFAQRIDPIGTDVFNYRTENVKLDYVKKVDNNVTKNKAGRSDWLSPVSLREISGAAWDGASFLRLFPDSFTYILPTDGSEPFQPAFHILGSSFDPTDPLYSTQTTGGYTLNRFDSYNVDSVRFSYAYVRETDSIGTVGNRTEVVDTLFFHYIAPAQMNRFYYNDRSQGGFGIPRGFDQGALAPANATYVDTILLTNALATDTERSGDNLSIGRLVVPIPAEFGLVEYDYDVTFGGLPVGASLTYKPGIPYAAGDTIISFDDNITLETQFNDFGTVGYSNIGSDIIDLEAYNNSFVSNRQVRYGQEFGSLMGFLPIIKTLGWGRDLFVDFDFFISEPAGEEWASAKGVNQVQAAVYPNPVNAGKAITVRLTDAADLNDVNITLTDLLGNVVNANATATNGNSFEISTEGVSSGIYFVNIQSGAKTGTYKVVVSK